MKKIALAADHAGYELKNHLVAYLTEKGYDCVNLGTDTADSVDYPVYANALCEKILSGECEKGIVICGTGIGMSLAANKVPGIRCALCGDPYSAKMTRAHNDANMLALGARVIGVELAKMIVEAFLDTPFEGGRHQTRIDMITALENGKAIE